MILLKFLFKEMLDDGKMWKRVAKEAELIEPNKPIATSVTSVRGGRLYNPQTSRAETPQQAIIRRGEEARKQKGLPPIRPKQEAIIDETTDLRSLVAKTPSEEHAQKIAQFLSSNKIQARAADDAIFNPRNETEQPSWGIFVKSSEVVNAGELLHRQKMAHGLSFDPYVKGGK